MKHRIFQTNSLRLNRLIGCGDHTHGPHPEWFYNGSLKFEEDENGPRVFQSLSGAVAYFTEKSYECERSRGQYVTWAEATANNWVLYVYIGPDTSDASYSNPKNWWPFGEARPEPYSQISEAINADKAFVEKLDAHYTIEEKLEVKQE